MRSYNIYIAMKKPAAQFRVKLFKHGGSQAVRLPKELRLEGTEALGRREGDLVILQPVKKRPWPKGYWTMVDRLKKTLKLDDVGPLKGRLLDLSAEEL